MKLRRESLASGDVPRASYPREFLTSGARATVSRAIDDTEGVIFPRVNREIVMNKA